MSNDDRLLTVDEVAAMLRVSVFTIRREIAMKRLAAFKVGRAFRITQSALDAYKKSRSA